MKWMKYGDFSGFDDVCDAIRQPAINDTNNNHSNNYNNKSSQDAVNDNDDTEIDNISLEILSQPENDMKITADIVFVHGLHGMCTQFKSDRLFTYSSFSSVSVSRSLALFFHSFCSHKNMFCYVSKCTCYDLNDVRVTCTFEYITRTLSLLETHSNTTCTDEHRK